jgi:hypothetical protein
MGTLALSSSGGVEGRAISGILVGVDLDSVDDDICWETKSKHSDRDLCGKAGGLLFSLWHRQLNFWIVLLAVRFVLLLLSPVTSGEKPTRSSGEHSPGRLFAGVAHVSLPSIQSLGG